MQGPTDHLVINIPGEPFSKQSARFYAKQISGKTVVRSHQSKEVKANQEYVRLCAVTAKPRDFKIWEGPIAVKVTYIFAPPKSWPKHKKLKLASGHNYYKTTKPDLTDNLNKGVFDALEGLIFKNDSQICVVESLVKKYGLAPATIVELKQITHESKF